MSDTTILKCDAKPLLFLIEILDRALKFAERPLDLSDFTFEIARVELNNSSTGTSEVRITLYPSDAFLSFVTTLWAGDFDFSFSSKSMESA